LGSDTSIPADISTGIFTTCDYSIDLSRFLENERSLLFKQFFSFMMKIGNLAEEVKHHPDFKLGWGYLEIEITTHSVQGLTQADFELASKINHILSDK
jgi:4a-hydroxytetrahydrobiopterin dehydratase